MKGIRKKVAVEAHAKAKTPSSTVATTDNAQKKTTEITETKFREGGRAGALCS